MARFTQNKLSTVEWVLFGRAILKKNSEKFLTRFLNFAKKAFNCTACTLH